MADLMNPTVLGLLSLLFINCGVLYMMFDNHFAEICDASGSVDSCDKYAYYMDTNYLAYMQQKKHLDWKRAAQDFRNESEKQKCEIERTLQKDFQDGQYQKAEQIVAQCMADFAECMTWTSTTTTTPDCSGCNSHCAATTWTWDDQGYNNLMTFNGECEGNICPWKPECHAPLVSDFFTAGNKCENHQCGLCTKVACTTTMTTTTSTNTTTSSSSTNTTTTTNTTTVYTTVTTTNTTTTTTTTSTTTTTNVTNTTVTTITNTTTTTSTSTTSTSTNTTVTTTTSTITSTNTSTTTNTTNHTTTTVTTSTEVTSTTSNTTTVTTTNTTTVTTTTPWDGINRTVVTTTTNSSTSTNTTTTTSTTTSTSTNSSTTTNTTTTTPPPCVCQAVDMDEDLVAIVGRPMKLFVGGAHRRRITVMNQENHNDFLQVYPEEFVNDFTVVKKYQGVYIPAGSSVAAGGIGGGGFLEGDCFTRFSNRSYYWYPNQQKSYADIYKMYPNLDPADENSTEAQGDQHVDLGCGYTGMYKIKCHQENEYEVGNGICNWKLDLSQCVPPTYEKALAECFTIETTTLTTTTKLPIPVFMDIIKNNLTVAELPDKFEIPTVLPPSENCCEPYVSSVCMTNINFPRSDVDANGNAMYPDDDPNVKTQTSSLYGEMYNSKTTRETNAPKEVIDQPTESAGGFDQDKSGTWNPARSYHDENVKQDQFCEGGTGTCPAGTCTGTCVTAGRGSESYEGYFTMVKCDKQVKSVAHRPCPLVQIVYNSTRWEEWPQCEDVCNITKANGLLHDMCMADKSARYEAEATAHADKIKSMKDKHVELESWTSANSFLTVHETKIVLDCTMTNSPNSIPPNHAIPQVTNGYDMFQQQEECRLHGCEPNQCLVKKRACPLPYIWKFPFATGDGGITHGYAAGAKTPETRTCDRDTNTPKTRFECVDKQHISSSNPMSLSFGLMWISIGMGLGVAAMYLLFKSGGAKVHPYQPEGAD